VPIAGKLRRSALSFPNDREVERLRRRLRLALSALVLVTAFGVLGYLIIGWPEHGLIDAVYMTVITLTTVGYGEVIDLGAGGRVFTIALLLAGMGIVAYTVPQLAAFAIEGQIGHAFMRRRMQKLIANLRQHFVVCGDHAVAVHAVQELLRTRHSVVAVYPEGDEMAARLAAVDDLPRVVGDPTSDAVLRAAGIEHAAGIVFCMESDKDNILGVLTARRLAPAARVVAASNAAEAEAKLRIAGANAVVQPSRIGGLRMASELVRPKVVSFLDMMLRDEQTADRVEEIVIPDGAPAHRVLADLGCDTLPHTVLMAVRHPDGRFEVGPPPSTPMVPGLTAIVITDPDGRAALTTRARG